MAFNWECDKFGFGSKLGKKKGGVLERFDGVGGFPISRITVIRGGFVEREREKTKL
ncbi:putative glutamyl-tRNA synthetase, mitochondrial-like protein [Corchorus capsularis]|uniref:Putative glutamyl-tRNA synthetase, mitochondrial-like protein n=1 Tax=Corchorus capsularis TaxID=210143 RepID=A0A1R3JN58_COCAP|nr:putative glutamyl-tRNA synthetase, mitochondrial-like protein [Corchorus capsularis]